MPIKPKLKRRWGKPNKLIESTPEISKKEAFFIKSGKEIKEISKNRAENAVGPDLEKYNAFELKHKGKHIIRIHTHGPGIRHMPSPADIAVFFMDFFNNHLMEKNKTIQDSVTKQDLKNSKSEVISVIDEKGKETGRIHVHLSLEAVNQLKEYFLMMSVYTKEQIENKIAWDIQQLTRKQILKKHKKGIELTDDQKYRLHLHATRYYYEKVLKMNVHFKGMPGYKYNEKLCEFEKV
ncbi:MAG TPA: hypothetical protein PLK55_03620 [archaeon]|jgi:uncharacterized protein YrzB (UPF0473 family)|nr:hypothetical protein [archaeon]